MSENEQIKKNEKINKIIFEAINDLIDLVGTILTDDGILMTNSTKEEYFDRLHDITVKIKSNK